MLGDEPDVTDPDPRSKVENAKLIALVNQYQTMSRTVAHDASLYRIFMVFLVTLSQHQENGRVVFGVFVSRKLSLMSLSLVNPSFVALCLGWMSFTLEGYL